MSFCQTIRFAYFQDKEERNPHHRDRMTSLVIPLLHYETVSLHSYHNTLSQERGGEGGQGALPGCLGNLEIRFLSRVAYYAFVTLTWIWTGFTPHSVHRMHTETGKLESAGRCASDYSLHQQSCFLHCGRGITPCSMPNQDQQPLRDE